MTDDHYEALLSALKDGTLNPTGFSHRDHVGVAVAALRRPSFLRGDADRRQRLAGRDSAARWRAREVQRHHYHGHSISLIAERWRRVTARSSTPSSTGIRTCCRQP